MTNNFWSGNLDYVQLQNCGGARNMDLRLAYRIATMPCSPPNMGAWDFEPDKAAVLGRLHMESAAVRDVPKLIFDEVARFFAEHERQEWDHREDVPNWAPPFGHFFVEWNNPRAWNFGQRVEESADGQVGLLAMALNVTEENKTDVPNWLKLMGHMAGFSQPAAGVEDRLTSALQASRWVIWASPWMTAAPKPISGRPFWMGIYMMIFVEPDGKLNWWNAIGPCLEVHRTEAGMKALGTMLDIFGLGLSFLHCKNVRQVETTDDRGTRWHRDNKVSAFRFRTLEIDPMREVLRREGRSDQVDIQKALHICRGHFATYTEDRPLFGKHVGTFWKPDHVRGNATQGIVEKDYSVQAGVNDR